MNNNLHHNTISSQDWQLYITRMVWYCVLIGILGAVASLIFNGMVHFTSYIFLNLFADYSPPGLPSEGQNTIEYIGGSGRWLIPVSTTFGAFLSGWLVYRFAAETEGAGTGAVIQAYHHNGGKIRARVPIIKAIASALTIGSGGAAGRQGPMAQISAGLASIIASSQKLSDRDRRLLVLAGLAAGIAAIFRSPFGAAIFAIEVLYFGMEFEARMMIYTTISAVTAYAINGIFMGWTPIFHISPDLTFSEPLNLLWFIILGVLAGLYGSMIPKVFYGIRDIFKRWYAPAYIKSASAGLLVGLLALLFPQILGGGYGWIQQILDGQVGLALILILLIVKLLAMSLTIGSGASGGIFAPSLFTGVLLGVAVASVINLIFPGLELNIQSFAVVGMAAVFAGVARVPIAALMMAVEMTGGYGLIVPTMISVMISYMVQSSLSRNERYKTIYETQVLDRPESPVHH